MEELKEYLDNHKGFRLTKEMIEKVMSLVEQYGNEQWQNGFDLNDRNA